MSRRYPDKKRPQPGKQKSGFDNRRSGKPTRGGKSDSSDQLHLYGLHTVRAALENPERKKIELLASKAGLSRLGDCVAQSGVDVTVTEPRVLDGLVGVDAVHQGVVLKCEPLNELDASELFHLADAKLLLVLDQITDPHNVGAILRSAVAMGVDAVLTTHRNSAVETGVLAKSASGALDMVQVIGIRNLSKALEELNSMRIATIGLDSEGPLVLEETFAANNLSQVAIVLGSEGKGLREKTRETCTYLARLDMPGPIKSLNVSNAAALSLYLASKI